MIVLVNNQTELPMAFVPESITIMEEINEGGTVVYTHTVKFWVRESIQEIARLMENPVPLSKAYKDKLKNELEVINNDNVTELKRHESRGASPDLHPLN